MTPPGCLLCAGFLFLVAGILGFFFLNLRGQRQRNVGAGVIGGLAAAGLVLTAAGIFDVTRATRVRRNAAPSDGGAPEAGVRWNRALALDETGLRALGQLYRFAWLAALLVPANAWVFFSSRPPPGCFVHLATVVLDLVATGVLVRAIFLLARFRRFGSGELRFDRFPFHPGETFEARLKTRRPLPATGALIITLQCVKESVETQGSGRNRSSSDVSTRIYSEERRIERDGVREHAPEIHLRFQLPSGEYGTDFNTQYPRYWELTVRDEVFGPDYFAVFLIPVFSR